MHRLPLACFLFCVTTASFVATAPAQHPNVVFILTDDQRWDTISLNERSQVKTPNIDRLGREHQRSHYSREHQLLALDARLSQAGRRSCQTGRSRPERKRGTFGCDCPISQMHVSISRRKRFVSFPSVPRG